MRAISFCKKKKKIHWFKIVLITSDCKWSVFGVVLNSLFFFFYEKILHTPKAQKSTKKHKKAQKAQNATSEQ